MAPSSQEALLAEEELPAPVQDITRWAGRDSHICLHAFERHATMCLGML